MASSILRRVERKPPAKDAGGTRERILEVALQEFSAKGLSGARVDEIAELTQTSKRMIYYHFGSKEELYRAVLERIYAGLRKSEAHLDTEHMPPEEALASIVRVSFDYHRKHETFVRLVMNENIHYAEHLKQIPAIGAANSNIIETLRRILERGVETGVFRPNIDPLQLHMTISSFGFLFVSNRYTFSHIFENDMSSPAAAARRRAVAVETVLAWCGPQSAPCAATEDAPSLTAVASPRKKAVRQG
jgi:AcrR family transcriptional regulator